MTLFFFYWLEVFSGFMAVRGELPSRLWKIQGIIGHAWWSNGKWLKGKSFLSVLILSHWIRLSVYLVVLSSTLFLGGFFYCSFFKIGYIQNWYIVVLPEHRFLLFHCLRYHYPQQSQSVHLVCQVLVGKYSFPNNWY